jgi:hypothetical protein
MPDRQRVEEQTIEDAESSGAGGDADDQGKGRHAGKCAIPPQHADAAGRVLKKLSESHQGLFCPLWDNQ